jgi:hypothetical protein
LLSKIKRGLLKRWPLFNCLWLKVFENCGLPLYLRKSSAFPLLDYRRLRLRRRFSTFVRERRQSRGKFQRYLGKAKLFRK